MIPALLIVGFALWRLRHWDAVWDDLMQSEAGTPYHRAVIGAGHALLGAGLMALSPDAGIALVAVRAAVALGYWLLKEARDLRTGGDLRDGIEDAAFVWLGTYYGPWWWPLVIIGAMGCVMLTGRTNDNV